MNWSSAAAAALALAVGLGAFAAHGLRGRLDEYSAGIYEKAVFYHFIHALGLLAVSIVGRMGHLPSSAGSLACWLLAGGMVFFSGSLYLLAVSGQRWLGAVTPIGGVMFIAGWLVLAWALAAR
jgi:uncharacterized membrane protein YgdD (TMEM256/DUF423 family)